MTQEKLRVEIEIMAQEIGPARISEIDALVFIANEHARDAVEAGNTMTDEKRNFLLSLLSEECHEVGEAAAQTGIRASKALRFGMNEVQEGQGLTNAQRVLRGYFKMLDEFTDVVAMMEMVFADNDMVSISTEILRTKIEDKKIKVAVWKLFADDLKGAQNEH